MESPPNNKAAKNIIASILLPLLGLGSAFLLSTQNIDLLCSEKTKETLISLSYILFSFLLLYQLISFLMVKFIGARTSKPVPNILRHILGGLLACIGALIALILFFPNIWSTILAFSSVIGVVIGLALRPIILDIFSGISTNLDAAFHMGDWIEVHDSSGQKGFEGFVQEINWRTTLLKTKAGNYLIFPNSYLSSAAVTNYSRPNALSRFDLKLHLPPEVNPKRAERLLTTAVNATLNEETGPSKQQGAQVYLTSLDRALAEYTVRYWVNRGQHSHTGVRNRLFQSILQHLNLAGIPLAEDSILNLETREIRKEASTTPPLELLSRVDIFAGAESSTLMTLSQNLTPVDFGAEQTLISQGEVNQNMFILVEGGVDVIVSDDNQDITVATMNAGDYFGEMSLFTGEARTATIRSNTSGRAYQISRESIAELLTSDSSLLSLLSTNLAKRNHNRTRKLDEAKQALSLNERKNLASALLIKMKKVFSLPSAQADNQESPEQPKI